MDEILDLKTRKQIYKLIVRQPGINIADLSSKFNIDVPLAIYHLRHLEKHGLISMDKEKGFTRCFQKNRVGQKDKTYFTLFRNEIALKIVLILLKTPNSGHQDILKHFDMSPPLLSYHLRKLLKKHIIEIQVIQTKRKYHVVNEDEITRFLIRYKPYKLHKGMSDTWEDFKFHYKK